MKIAVIGLGYVGLPLAMVFAESGVQVVGVEAVAERCAEINAGRSYIQDVPGEALAAVVTAGLVSATTDYAATEDCDAVIICLPTPLNANREPDLTLVKDATQSWPGTCGAASWSLSRAPRIRAPRATSWRPSSRPAPGSPPAWTSTSPSRPSGWIPAAPTTPPRAHPR